MPQEQIYIPCFDGLACPTDTIPAKPLSVIAGHFTWMELERAGVAEVDCMVIFRPAPSSMPSPLACLAADVHQWSSSDTSDRCCIAMGCFLSAWKPA